MIRAKILLSWAAGSFLCGAVTGCLGALLYWASVLSQVQGERDAAQQETAEIANQCATDLIGQRQELNHEMAEFYFEKAADIFQCAEEICRGNGWTEPPEWGVDDWIPTPDWEDVEEEAAREK